MTTSCRRSRRVRDLLPADSGVSAIEYGIILALFALAVVVGSSLLFQGMRAAYVGSSGDVGTPAQPTVAPSNSAVPDPTRDPDEPPPPHTPVVAPVLTRTVICSSAALDVNIRTALRPIENATALTATHADARVIDSGRVIRYTPDTSSACDSTVTIPYSFSYRDDGVFYTDGTGELQVRVLKPAIAATQTQSVWCNPSAEATFDLSSVLSGWPNATITGTSHNGGGTVQTDAPTTIRYELDTSGGDSDCGRTRTINYTFSYEVDGVTYSDGTGVLRVEVSRACDLDRTQWTLGDWSNRGYVSASDDGQGELDLESRANNPRRYRYLRYTPSDADCGSTVRIDYTYTYRTGSWPWFDWLEATGSYTLDVRP